MKSRTLATLRDTLVPKLLNGELSVAAVPSILSKESMPSKMAGMDPMVPMDTLQKPNQR